MPRRKSLVTVIRDMVREQVQEAVQGFSEARDEEEARDRPPQECEL